VNLSFNPKERHHKGRNRKGCHVYLSRYFAEFKATSAAQQVSLINLVRRDAGEDEDTRSIDSTDTPQNEAIKSWEIIKLAYLRWSKLAVTVRDSWQRRADILNRFPIPGKLTRIPANIIGHVEALTLQSLTNEWKSIVGKILASVKKDLRRIVSAAEYWFCHEKVQILSQTFRVVSMSFIMMNTLFGIDFSNLRREEIIRCTKHVVLLHISTQLRIKELLTVNTLCAVEGLNRVRDDIVHSCCGKVSVTNNRTRISIIGYILEKEKDKWKVRMTNNVEILITPAIFDYNEKKYRLRIKYEGEDWYITQYWPIRLMVEINKCTMRYTLNRVAFNMNTANIVPQHSS